MDNFYRKNYKSALIMRKNKKRCSNCGYFLCTCQTTLTEFNKNEKFHKNRSKIKKSHKM